MEIRNGFSLHLYKLYKNVRIVNFESNNIFILIVRKMGSRVCALAIKLSSKHIQSLQQWMHCIWCCSVVAEWIKNHQFYFFGVFNYASCTMMSFIHSWYAVHWQRNHLFWSGLSLIYHITYIILNCACTYVYALGCPTHAIHTITEYVNPLRTPQQVSCDPMNMNGRNVKSIRDIFGFFQFWIKTLCNSEHFINFHSKFLHFLVICFLWIWFLPLEKQNQVNFVTWTEQSNQLKFQ